MRCDSHVHIVGPLDRFPQVADRTYTAGVASVEAVRRNGVKRGITRFIVVQPSFYGTDNTATLDALELLGRHGRGVAVINPASASDAMLANYHDRGVRGLRVNLYRPIKAPVGDKLDAAFEATAIRAKPLGWHVQVIVPLATLLANADVLARSAVPVVIDHYGLYGKTRPTSAEGKRLLELMGSPQVWMKLSAPYRLADGPLNTRPDPAWIAAMLDAAPDRCVWGSDWPFTPPQDAHRGAAVEVPYRDLSYETLVDEFMAALPSAEFADRIMRDNPARLYGF